MMKMLYYPICIGRKFQTPMYCPILTPNVTSVRPSAVATATLRLLRPRGTEIATAGWRICGLIGRRFSLGPTSVSFDVRRTSPLEVWWR